MSNINEEINEMAENMEKSTTSDKERLIDTIMELGPEGLKKAIPALSDENKELLKSVIEEMTKAKSLSMDDEYAPEKTKTKIPDIKQESQTGSDDEDEDLVKEKAKEHKHQGDNQPEGFEGEVIKAEKLEGGDADNKADSKYDANQLEMGIKHEMEHTDDKAVAKEIAKDHLEENAKYYTDLKKIEKAKYIRKIGTGPNAKYIYKENHPEKGTQYHISENAPAKGSEQLQPGGKADPKTGKYTTFTDKNTGTKTKMNADQYANKKMLQADESKITLKPNKDYSTKEYHKDSESNISAMKQRSSEDKFLSQMSEKIKNKEKEAVKKSQENKEFEMNFEEMLKSLDEESVYKVMCKACDKGIKKDKMYEKLSKYGMEKSAIDKIYKRVEKDHVKKSDKIDSEEVVKKSIQYQPKNLLKANTLGRNCHYEVNELIECQEKTKEDVKKSEDKFGYAEEKLEKSEKDESKKLDINEIIEKGFDYSREEIQQIEGLRDHKTNGKLVKSFDDEDLLASLNMSKEDAEKLLKD